MSKSKHKSASIGAMKSKQAKTLSYFFIGALNSRLSLTYRTGPNCDLHSDEVRKKNPTFWVHKLAQMKSIQKGTNKKIKVNILRACMFSVATYKCET